MNRILLLIVVMLALCGVANADCYLVDYTSWSPTGRGTWACWDYKGNPYTVNMNLWQGLIDLGL